MEQKKKIKIIIIILAVLLAISLAALGYTIYRNRQANSAAATVTVPDNLITPDEEPDNTNEDSSESTDNNESNESNKTPAITTPAAVTPPSPVSPGEAVTAATIRLYNRRPEDNTAFQVGNMFPGDAETKYFCVRVSYRDTVTVHYKATVRPGYEKLAEVLKTRVRLLTSGETLYDGLMSQMPESVTHKLSSGGSATDELYYEITAYLDTSVGNEYQNKELIADFSWWVDETGKLIESPDTGDSSHILLWEMTAAASGFIMLLLLFTRRRKEGYDNV